MKRKLSPELLDSLTPDSPEARRSRADLVRINRIMGNNTWFVRTAPPLARPGERALELGSGDGRLALRLLAAGLPTDALDQFPAPADWPASARWHAFDLRDFPAWSEYPIVVGNLILHHLTVSELAALGDRLAPHARVLLFNEPFRHLRSRLLWTLAAPIGGASPVTRHDGRVSIEAGFRGDELPRALHLDPDRWHWRITTTVLGAYRMIALRRP
ncbi:MAG: hypothetical protein NTU80_01560 [Verrucomicrobia bacterium]|nr:hypothetical protein [Verrucomicrobiota bacterium]